MLQAWADLAEGCDEMAKKGILHRDLTLNNILVKKEGEQIFLKLCDFGVSGTPSDFKEIPRGKMRNYSPEAIGQSSDTYIYTPQSDLYMFALVIWEMLHAKLVWSQFNTALANKEVLKGQKP